MNNKNDKTDGDVWLTRSTWISLGIAIVVALWLFGRLIYDGYCLFVEREYVDYELVGQVGDFIGGTIGTLVAFVGVALVYLTFREQSRFNKLTTEKSEIEDFEHNFLNLLSAHSDIVKEMEIGRERGRKTFQILFEEFDKIYGIIHRLIQDLMQKDEMLLTAEQCEIVRFVKKTKKEGNLSELEIKYAYGYFFYGADYYTMTEDNNSSEAKLDALMTHSVINEYPNFPKSGRHSLLGHYFRNLYQIVTYVDRSDLLEGKNDEKYKFVKMLRTQMSDYEQILLYYNSLSPMGHVWQEPLGETDVNKMSLICRYRMIKNLPQFFEYPGIRPGDHFFKEKESLEKLGKRFFEQDPYFGKDENQPVSGYKSFCFLLISKAENRK